MRWIITKRIVSVAMVLVMLHPMYNREQLPIVIPIVHKFEDNHGLNAFLHKIAIIESDNDAHAINRFGMLGKYQFHPRTLKEIGIHVTKNDFLNNEALQDSAMIRYLKANARELSSVINHFSGKKVNGVLITKSGILAGAHLVGSVGILAYFYPTKYSHITKDANGTTVEMYMKRFGNYNLGI